MKPSCSAAQRGTPEAFSYASWLIFVQKHQLVSFSSLINVTLQWPMLLDTFLVALSYQGKFQVRPGTLTKADTNYLLLGLMIETLNGDTLPAIFRRRVFDPAGMSPKDTYCDLTHLVCRPMLLLHRPMFLEM